VPDIDKVTVKQAAKMTGLVEQAVREWFSDNNLRVWKRDKVLLSDLVLLRAERDSQEAAFQEMVRLSEEMGLYDLD
jgi:hypothetical protein